MEIDPPEDLELELIATTDADGLTRAASPEATNRLQLDFAGELWYWRGPAPYHFIRLPPEAARRIRAIAPAVTYGWGMIPVAVRIGDSAWSTALWPKDGGYVLPIKDRFRNAEQIDLGATVPVALTIQRRGD